MSVAVSVSNPTLEASLITRAVDENSPTGEEEEEEGDGWRSKEERQSRARRWTKGKNGGIQAIQFIHQTKLLRPNPIYVHMQLPTYVRTYARLNSHLQLLTTYTFTHSVLVVKDHSEITADAA